MKKNNAIKWFWIIVLICSVQLVYKFKYEEPYPSLCYPDFAKPDIPIFCSTFLFGTEATDQLLQLRKRSITHLLLNILMINYFRMNIWLKITMIIYISLGGAVMNFMYTKMEEIH